jgi:hypothetical protein
MDLMNAGDRKSKLGKKKITKIVIEFKRQIDIQDAKSIFIQWSLNKSTINLWCHYSLEIVYCGLNKCWWQKVKAGEEKIAEIVMEFKRQIDIQDAESICYAVVIK